MWNLQRISADNSLIDEYGLKNMRELWKVQTEISRIRGNVRLLLSASTAQNEQLKERMLGRLSRYGIASRESTLDNLLDLKENSILARRLQSLVFKKGLAKTVKQARQIITHGFISVNGKRVNRPGYMVTVDEEKHIGYYKPIDLGKIKTEEGEAKTEEKKAE